MRRPTRPGSDAPGAPTDEPFRDASPGLPGWERRHAETKRPSRVGRAPDADGGSHGDGRGGPGDGRDGADDRGRGRTGRVVVGRPEPPHGDLAARHARCSTDRPSGEYG